eukprot:TRINITY_DN2565_c0_g1_i9.p1 TRINITY_DN2565_c0_g1~~TRINITY_DN2565_c0_g1_i9.p1  ORF type:complete len:136 (-),score=4.06 TRINITY_DN2565_c0_g1_i9:49-456(-)
MNISTFGFHLIWSTFPECTWCSAISRPSDTCTISTCPHACLSYSVPPWRHAHHLRAPRIERLPGPHGIHQLRYLDHPSSCHSTSNHAATCASSPSSVSVTSPPGSLVAPAVNPLRSAARISVCRHMTFCTLPRST